METKDTFIPYGIVTGLVMEAMNAIFVASGLELRTGVSLLTYIPFILGLILNAKAYSKAGNSDITFGRAFKSCFNATCIIALIGAVWAAYLPFVFPGMVDKIVQAAHYKRGYRSGGVLGIDDDRLAITFGFIIVPVIYLFWGTLISLFAAAIAKKNPYVPEPVSDNTFDSNVKY